METKHTGSNKLKFLLIMAVFGSIGLLTRLVDLPSAMIACLRAWIAAITLTLFIVITKRKYPAEERKKIFCPMLASGIMLAVDWIGLFLAFHYTTIATATACYYIMPILLLFAAPLVLHERFTKRHAVCAAVAFLGMTCVAGIWGSGLPALSEIKGILFAVLGALGYGGVVLINKRFPEGDPILRTTLQTAVTAVVTTPYVLLTCDVNTIVFTAQDILILLLLGIGVTSVAYIIYFSLMTRIPAHSVGILSYADPVVSVFISLVVLQEPTSVQNLIGVALIIAAAAASELGHEPEKE